MICPMCLIKLEPHNNTNFCSVECYKEFIEEGGIE